MVNFRRWISWVKVSVGNCVISNLSYEATKAASFCSCWYLLFNCSAYWFIVCSFVCALWQVLWTNSYCCAEFTEVVSIPKSSCLWKGRFFRIFLLLLKTTGQTPDEHGCPQWLLLKYTRSKHWPYCVVELTTSRMKSLMYSLIQLPYSLPNSCKYKTFRDQMLEVRHCGGKKMQLGLKNLLAFKGAPKSSTSDCWGNTGANYFKRLCWGVCCQASSRHEKWEWYAKPWAKFIW